MEGVVNFLRPFSGDGGEGGLVRGYGPFLHNNNNKIQPSWFKFIRRRC